MPGSRSPRPSSRPARAREAPRPLIFFTGMDTAVPWCSLCGTWPWQAGNQRTAPLSIQGHCCSMGSCDLNCPNPSAAATQAPLIHLNNARGENGLGAGQLGNQSPESFSRGNLMTDRPDTSRASPLQLTQLQHLNQWYHVNMVPTFFSLACAAATLAPQSCFVTVAKLHRYTPLHLLAKLSSAAGSGLRPAIVHL